MIAVVVHSVRVSLLSHHRVVLLKEEDAERSLPIWIGPFEAESIVMALQHAQPPRPQTHDLLKNVIEQMGGSVSHILVNALADNTFFGRIVLDVSGQHVEIDSRPSDAIALAVRCDVPIYVAEGVMDQAGIVPSPDIEPASVDEEDQLSLFRDFVNTLDLDEEENEDKEK